MCLVGAIEQTQKSSWHFVLLRKEFLSLFTCIQSFGIKQCGRLLRVYETLVRASPACHCTNSGYAFSEISLPTVLPSCNKKISVARHRAESCYDTTEASPAVERPLQTA